MAYPTDFLGHVEVRPGLNEAEQTYLARFARSRRWRRPEGPYALPADPAAEPTAGSHAWNVPADGQPTLWCDWTPCWNGGCLTWAGEERFAGVGTWLAYLIDHFLRPGAVASHVGGGELAGFTFDHVLEGMVVGCRRDNKQLFAVSVRDNRVREEILRPGDRRLRAMPALPYEALADARRAATPAGPPGRTAQVLPFTGASTRTVPGSWPAGGGAA